MSYSPWFLCLTSIELFGFLLIVPGLLSLPGFTFLGTQTGLSCQHLIRCNLTESLSWCPELPSMDNYNTAHLDIAFLTFWMSSSSLGKNYKCVSIGPAFTKSSSPTIPSLTASPWLWSGHELSPDWALRPNEQDVLFWAQLLVALWSMRLIWLYLRNIGREAETTNHMLSL